MTGSRSPRLAARAKTSLLEHEDATRALELGLGHDSTEVRSHCAYHIGQLGPERARAAVVPLTLRLKYERAPQPLSWCVGALARLDNHAGLPVLIAQMDRADAAAEAGRAAIEILQRAGRDPGAEPTYEALKAGLEAMGLRFIVEPAHRLPQLNAVTIPEGVDDAAVRRRLLEEHHLEIGAGLGDLAGKVWRIGLMGYGSRIENVTQCLGALDAVLADMGAPVSHGVALPAAEKILAA